MGRCTGKQIEPKTVRVGDDVHLTCPRTGSGTLFWIRLVSGNLPKVLGKTYSYEHDPRITATEGHGTFDLHIGKAKLSDAAVYYCVKTPQGEIIFLEGTDLRVEGPQPVTTAVPTSDPVHPEDSVTLQCSVLSDSENKTHPEEKCMCCFRAGSHQSPPSFNYTQGDSVYQNETNPEKVSTKKCTHSFLKNISSSDAGTYHCAVAKCGERFSDKRSNLTTEAVHVDQVQDKTVLCLLCAALAISLIVIAFLIYLIKKLKKNSYHCYTAVALQTNATASGNQERQQTDEDSLVYSAPTFTSRKARNSQRTSNYTVVQSPTVSDPVRPGDSVTLQCSVLSESENKTCPGDHSVYWFRAGSDKSHPEIIYTDGNDCEKRSDSLRSCAYHFSNNVSSSDSGTYYCAVATCGEIIFGNGTKLDIEDSLVPVVTVQLGEPVTFTCPLPNVGISSRQLHWKLSEVVKLTVVQVRQHLIQLRQETRDSPVFQSSSNRTKRVGDHQCVLVSGWIK
ncbi:uncharacterized protein AKAME5_002176200 [Lates japonicus]|uniref:Ig-like domain-containing protein n=1 Tax=Lates japonicus TaxID=270547 RepID=A0AAD3NG07_LATJO|nr:uncharacterized protein AKAME5_002176200 [Lates japonicus]